MLRNYTAYFVVELFDGVDSRTEAGFYPVTTFGEAMNAIEKFYGDELCVVSRLELMDTAMITMDKEVAEEILKNY